MLFVAELCGKVGKFVHLTLHAAKRSHPRLERGVKTEPEPETNRDKDRNILLTND